MGWGDILSKWTDYMVPDAIYSQETGGWFGDDPRARRQAYADLRRKLPQAGPAWTPETRQMFGYAQRLIGQEPGAGYQQTPYYRGLMSGVEDMGRQMGWRTGAQQAAAGTLGTGQTGAARRAQTERGVQMLKAQERAAGQAYQAKAQTDLARFNQALQGAGFAQGIQDADFRRQYRAYLLDQGLTLGEIDANLAAIDRAWAMGTGLVKTGFSLFDMLGEESGPGVAAVAAGA